MIDVSLQKRMNGDVLRAITGRTIVGMDVENVVR